MAGDSLMPALQELHTQIMVSKKCRPTLMTFYGFVVQGQSILV